MRGNGIGRSFWACTIIFPRMPVLTRTLTALMFCNLGGSALAEDAGTLSLPKADGTTLHVQSTFIPQGNLPFRAPYSGPQSLDPTGQAVETVTATGFFGARVWDGGEVYFNPEAFHGFGLRNPDGTRGSVGLAGFANGDAQKGGRWDVDFEIARLYVSQTIGFGGEKEKIEDTLNQVAGEKDYHRLTFTFGRFAVNDFFDANAYAHDPRTQFMNWAIWESGAFDYPADAKGYTAGAVADYNTKDWAFRLGYFLVPNAPNSLTLDTDVIRHGGAVAEFEGRYQIFSQAGKLRMLGFENTVFAGSYAQAVDLMPQSPDLTATRKDRTSYGFAINVEQAVTSNIGVFVRLSRNDGKTELCCFTDIMGSAAGGVSIKGTEWGRPDDTVGIAGAMNMLSPSARRYFKAGGLGLLIGDGTLTYAGEDIFEAYYSCAVTKNLSVSADYQFFANPAYNSDRGPVHVLGGRVHIQF